MLSSRRKPKSQNGTIEYELDEFQPIKGVSFFIYGTCDIDYDYDCDGIGLDVMRISINGDSKDKPALNLDSSSELYKMIENRLLEDRFWIDDAILKDLESNYPDTDYDYE